MTSCVCIPSEERLQGWIQLSPVLTHPSQRPCVKRFPRGLIYWKNNPPVSNATSFSETSRIAVNLMQVY